MPLEAQSLRRRPAALTAGRQESAAPHVRSAPSQSIASRKEAPTSSSSAPPSIDAAGASEKLERWVEFVQKGAVKGREVVSIVPENEVKNVVKDAPPPKGGSKVQLLKGNDYVRVWINKAGNHYLIHLPTSAATH